MILDELTYDEVVAAIAELKTRIQATTFEITNIDAQLADPQRMTRYNAYTYQQWRTRAIGAKGHLIRESGQLRQQLTQYQQHESKLRQQLAQQRKQERADQQNQLMEQARQKLAATDAPEVALIRRLYGALARLHRLSGQAPTELDKETFEMAHAYLLEHGGFI